MLCFFSERQESNAARNTQRLRGVEQSTQYVRLLYKALVEIYKLEQAATGSSVICDANRNNGLTGEAKNIF